VTPGPPSGRLVRGARRWLLRTWAPVLLTFAWSCASPPDAAQPAGPVTVNGSESIAWSQAASATDDVSKYRYVGYVDSVPHSLADAACQAGTSPTLFECSARLPPMSPGTHQLQLAAIVDVGGKDVEGQKSSPLDLLVIGTRRATAALRSAAPLAMTAQDGTRFNVETLVTGLDVPSAVAVTADGRLFVAERSGTVQVWQSGRMRPEPAVQLADAAAIEDVGLVGMTLHPDFSRNGRVYVVYAAMSASGTFSNRVIRFRDVNSVFGEAAVILEDAVVEPPQRTPRIRFGPDRKLYVAFPAGADRSRQDSSYSGKVLRINDDGTTPRDNPGYSPVISAGHRAPGAFDWQPATGQVWQSERGWDDRDRLEVRGSGDPPYAFDSPVDSVAAAFSTSTEAIAGFRNDLFIAALGGRHIRRVRFDPSAPTHVSSTERLLADRFGRISDVVTGPDGAIYFCTSNRRDPLDAAAGDDRVVRLASRLDR
jgi:glucose/arabinose dehydrogenase